MATTGCDDSRVDFIDVLVAAGANVDARGSDGATPLLWSRSIKVVRSLVNHCADVNAKTEDGRTPLHIAVTPGLFHPCYGLNIVETVDFLLKAGADETMVDNEGATALTRSMDRSHADVPDQLTRARELLANAPTDRRWRRRALLFMCIARHRRGEARLLDEAAGGASDSWTRAAAWVLEAGFKSGMERIFRTIVGYL